MLHVRGPFIVPPHPLHPLSYFAALNLIFPLSENEGASKPPCKQPPRPPIPQQTASTPSTPTSVCSFFSFQERPRRRPPDELDPVLLLLLRDRNREHHPAGTRPPRAAGGVAARRVRRMQGHGPPGAIDDALSPTSDCDLPSTKRHWFLRDEMKNVRARPSFNFTCGQGKVTLGHLPHLNLLNLAPQGQSCITLHRHGPHGKQSYIMRQNVHLKPALKK